ncbi:hypothetical protein Fcan01_15612 [Folsomia candida]|uniref:Uncharacterized protein n=1 Tax=Folsomia candida TaxID=158441 RepID=A0A226DW52_FOLCA|nr:hypothetical protein Fcan01_15612 [Folsomia candida]
MGRLRDIFLFEAISVAVIRRGWGLVFLNNLKMAVFGDTNPEITVNTITSSNHYFFTNYDFLIDAKEGGKDFIFIPLTFLTSFFRDYLNDPTSDCGHFAFLFVDTIKNFVAFFDPNYHDKTRHIYSDAIAYAAAEIGNVWGREFSIRDTTKPSYFVPIMQNGFQLFNIAGKPEEREFHNYMFDLFPYMHEERGDCSYAVCASASLLKSDQPIEVNDIVALIHKNRDNLLWGKRLVARHIEEDEHGYFFIQ